MNNTTENDNKRLYSCMEAAIKLGIHYGSIMTFKRKGMPHVKLEGRAYFDIEVCRAWLAERKNKVYQKRVESVNKARTKRKAKLNNGDVVAYRGEYFIINRVLRDEISQEAKNVILSPIYMEDTNIIARAGEVTLYARKAKGGEA